MTWSVMDLQCPPSTRELVSVLKVLIHLHPPGQKLRSHRMRQDRDPSEGLTKGLYPPYMVSMMVRDHNALDPLTRGSTIIQVIREAALFVWPWRGRIEHRQPTMADDVGVCVGSRWQRRGPYWKDLDARMEHTHPLNRTTNHTTSITSIAATSHGAT